MKIKLLFAVAIALSLGAFPQYDSPTSVAVEPMDHTPTFRVVVTSRTTPAVNYKHRSAATKIDFKKKTQPAKQEQRSSEQQERSAQQQNKNAQQQTKTAKHEQQAEHQQQQQYSAHAAPVQQAQHDGRSPDDRFRAHFGQEH